MTALLHDDCGNAQHDDCDYAGCVVGHDNLYLEGGSHYCADCFEYKTGTRPTEQDKVQWS